MAIDAETLSNLREIFVTRRECDASMDKMGKDLGDAKANLGIINAKLNIVLGILSAVGIAVLGLVVTKMWG